jgi:hypothetical protein
MLPILLALALPAQAAEDWLTSMRRAWEGVRTYRAEQRLLERVNGTLREEQVMQSVYRAPGEIQVSIGQGKHPARIYWSAQRYEGNVRLVREGRVGRRQGILTIGLESVDLRALVERRISHLDLGTFVNTFASMFATDATNLPAATPGVASDEAAWRVDVAGDTRNPWARASLAISQRTNLPVRVEFWDAQGVMLERHQWYGLVVNGDVDELADFSLGYPAR